MKDWKYDIHHAHHHHHHHVFVMKGEKVNIYLLVNMMMPNRLTNLPTSSMILFWITIISIIVQASLLPLADDETDKRTSHNIMRFGRQAGHNILRFGRTPGHNIMRFGKREESNSAPGSSFEMISDSKPISFLNDYQRSGYNHYGLFDPPSSSSSSLIPFNILINDNNNNNNNINDNNIDNLNSNNNGFDINTSYLPIGYYGQPSPLNPLNLAQRSLPYQQAKKGRPETDHVIMRFG
ncbi:serum factor response D-like [Panonychus citri]|uniref:serum factor response D-like n=1 Tax=Panonychus citri TaxID=50023 RepID=UPI002307B30F|nr:serum factor response D-like [Panonychus citri]